MSRLVLLRHGQSQGNADRRWQGWSDWPLTDRGRAEALAAGQQLAGCELGRSIGGAPISSDLRRARDTAIILGAVLGLSRPVVTDAQLRELDVGEWSGRTREEIAQRWPTWLGRWESGTAEGPPGGELLADFDDRVVSATVRWLSADDGGTRLIVAHGGFIRSLSRALGRPSPGVPNLAGVLVSPGQAGESWTMEPLPFELSFRSPEAQSVGQTL